MSKTSVREFAKELQLKVVHPGNTGEMEITSRDIYRPGLQLAASFYDYFSTSAVQIIGRTDAAYLNQLEPEVRLARLMKYFSFDVPCVIFCWGIEPPPEVIVAAGHYGCPVFVSHEHTTHLVQRCAVWLNNFLAPYACIHGVLMDVSGIGVLLMGDSGIGKSETALELIKRGNALVADDAVDIRRVTRDRLVGESPKLIRHMMEVRGVGMVDVMRMYGINAFLQSKSIDLIAYLEHWKQGQLYDRLGDREETMEILRVHVPKLTIPVAPGRNLAILVEVAARNFSLQRMGYYAVHEFEQRLQDRD